MNTEQLYALILGVVAVAAIAVLAYAQHTRRADLQELAAFFTPFVELAKARADELLAGYPQLATVHTALETAEGFFDEETDALVKIINSPGVIAAIRVALKEAQELTDGVSTSVSVGPTYAPPAASEAIKFP